MIYRPEFLITPPGADFEDRPYVYPISAFAGATLAAGAFTQEFPFQIETDADFWLCAIAYAVQGTLTSLCARIKDCFGNYLSDGWIAVNASANPAGVATDRGGGFSPVFDPPVFCPAGGVLLLSALNPGTTAATVNSVELRGYKRCGKVGCQ